MVGGAPPDHTHHTFGVPTIRSDLPAPRIKRVGDSKVRVCSCVWLLQVDTEYFFRTMAMRVMHMALCILPSTPAGKCSYSIVTVPNK